LIQREDRQENPFAFSGRQCFELFDELHDAHPVTVTASIIKHNPLTVSALLRFKLAASSLNRNVARDLASFPFLLRPPPECNQRLAC